MIYFHHANDYWTSRLPYEAIGHINVCENKYVDLWLNDGPALGINGSCTAPSPWKSCNESTYEVIIINMFSFQCCDCILDYFNAMIK